MFSRLFPKLAISKSLIKKYLLLCLRHAKALTEEKEQRTHTLATDWFADGLLYFSLLVRSLLFPMLVFVSDRTISKALGSGSVLLTGFYTLNWQVARYGWTCPRNHMII